MKFLFEWANGSETTEGKTIQEACGKIKTPVDEIMTGFLVRARADGPNPRGPSRRRGINHPWGYWDAEQFWKHLKGKPKPERI
jgi:hypothetical protein